MKDEALTFFVLQWLTLSYFLFMLASRQVDFLIIEVMCSFLYFVYIFLLHAYVFLWQLLRNARDRALGQGHRWVCDWRRP